MNEEHIDPEVSESPPVRDPFAHARPSEFYWIQLKPVFKGRLMLHDERLVQIAVTRERVAQLELLRLQVRIEDESVPPDTNFIEVLVDHRNQRVRFGPLQGLRIFPPQRGLAGFMLAQLIEWCQRHCGDYAVTPIILHRAEVPSEEARQARERILKRAGFHQTYSDDGRTEGKAQVNRVSDLVASWNVERVQPLHIAETLRQLREQETLNRQQQAQLTSLQATLGEYKRNDIGHRFAIGCLIVFSIFQALMLLWVVLR
ncbi:hypothetical protein SAMN05216198_1901 [Halopseudomonas litoralis]|uniref:Uncharacterized protein n=1 Tax=Halopseudomonas litoralis TaxID=797277 RepID=A0A1H1S1A4_9GAMM|nr:hypothetical protein [Halopseudomonas litoralis]SDS41747.1 hypothetical protein SAMN05216198_1901 [Halopseudomonas litoralis]